MAPEDCEFLIESPEKYLPRYCNGMMALGLTSITEHLIDRHEATAEMISDLTADQKYRLHDAIHAEMGDD